MSRLEILNSGALRLDGRKPHELRSLALHISPESPLPEVASWRSGIHHPSDGSARVEQGLTVVHAAVFGPREAKSRSGTFHDRAAMQVEVIMEPWSGRDRRKRGRGDRCVHVCKKKKSWRFSFC